MSAPLLERGRDVGNTSQEPSEGKTRRNLAYRLATEPPSTRRFVPVMNDARSEARKTTAAATSSIRPGRLNSMCGRLFARNCACASCGVTPRPLATVAIISANWGRHDERPRHRAHKNAAFRTRWKLNLSNEDRVHHDTLQPVREGI